MRGAFAVRSLDFGLYFESFVISAVASILAIRGDLPAQSPYAWGELAFSLVPAVMVVAGILRMPSDRVAAYRWFKRAVLVLILVTQFFAFYRHQFSALFGMCGNIIVLVTLNYMISEEGGQRREGPPRPPLR